MFTLTLVTPKKKLMTDVEVDEVIVPAYRGQLGILPGHAPLMSLLSAGTLKVKFKGSNDYKTAAISWGYLEVNPTGVVVLAQTAEWKEEVDKTMAQQELQKANERLTEAGLSPDDYAIVHRKIAKERARLEV
jgi:F-type H+-transporting ATPase subunit epsilon